MFSRVAGAGLALVAAALIAVAAAAPVIVPAELSLFSGHPTVSGRLRETQEVHIGFARGELCNPGGDGSCQSRPTNGGFQATAYGGLALAGLLTIGLLALAVLTILNSERRKGVALAIRVLSVLAAGVTGGLLAMGPFDASANASVPLGLGGPLLGAGVVVALFASVLAPRKVLPIRLRAPERGQATPRQAPAVSPAQAFVPAPDGQRRASRNSEPPPSPSWQDPRAAGNPQQPWHDPRAQAGAQPWQDPRAQASPAWPDARTPDRRSRELADPAGAVGGLAQLGAQDGFAPGQAQLQDDEYPVFPAVQHRPLYDAAPQHGGTGGLILERPAPVPAPRTTFSSPDDLPTPPPVVVEQPQLRDLQPVFGRGKPLTSPPPTMPRTTDDIPVSMFATTVQGVPPGGPPRPSSPAIPAASASSAWSSSELHGAAASASELHGAAASASELPRTLPHESSSPISALVSSSEAPLVLPPTPLAMAMPAPTAPTTWPGAETPLAPPPLPIAPLRPQRDSQVPPAPPVVPPRPQRDSQVPPAPLRPQRESQVPPPLPPPMPPPRSGHDTAPPRTAVRAAVPMPERPARPTASQTRPPIPPPTPLVPPRPRSPSMAPSPFVIPPIPAIPVPTIPALLPPRPPAAPAAPLPPPLRAETEADSDADGQTSPEPRSAALNDAAITPAPEFADITSTSNMSFAASTAEDIVAIDTTTNGSPYAPNQPDQPNQSLARELRKPETTDTTPSGQPISMADVNGTPTSERSMPKLPISTAPDSLPPPKDDKEQGGPSPACPQCESPMAWVDEHLRFYCKSCRMYF